MKIGQSLFCTGSFTQNTTCPNNFTTTTPGPHMNKMSKNGHLGDEYLKFSFYPYALFSFSSVFMLNKCPNALKVHTYDQVIHLVELCKIGGKTTIEAIGEATVF